MLFAGLRIVKNGFVKGKSLWAFCQMETRKPLMHNLVLDCGGSSHLREKIQPEECNMIEAHTHTHKEVFWTLAQKTKLLRNLSQQSGVFLPQANALCLASTVLGERAKLVCRVRTLPRIQQNQLSLEKNAHVCVWKCQSTELWAQRQWSAITWEGQKKGRREQIKFFVMHKSEEVFWERVWRSGHCSMTKNAQLGSSKTKQTQKLAPKLFMQFFFLHAKRPEFGWQKVVLSVYLKANSNVRTIFKNKVKIVRTSCNKSCCCGQRTPWCSSVLKRTSVVLRRPLTRTTKCGTDVRCQKCTLRFCNECSSTRLQKWDAGTNLHWVFSLLLTLFTVFRKQILVLITKSTMFSPYKNQFQAYCRQSPWHVFQTVRHVPDGKSVWRVPCCCNLSNRCCLGKYRISDKRKRGTTIWGRCRCGLLKWNRNFNFFFATWIQNQILFPITWFHWLGERQSSWPHRQAPRDKNAKMLKLPFIFFAVSDQISCL